VRIRKLDTETPRGEVWGKMEQANPAGSVKDRICLAMIEDAERRGALKPGGVVVEPTSGNTGIGLALVCAVKGYRCILTMPASMSLERRQLLESFGAEVVLTEPEAQMQGAISKAAELARELPSAFLPSQFDNPENPRIHARTTAREILEQTQGFGLDAFRRCVGTGGRSAGWVRSCAPSSVVRERGFRASSRSSRSPAQRSRAESEGLRRSRGSPRDSCRRTTTPRWSTRSAQ